MKRKMSVYTISTVHCYNSSISYLFSSPSCAAAQSAKATLTIGAAGLDAGSYLTLSNDGEDAVDVSGWSLIGDLAFTFRPGTVVAAGDTIVVAADIGAYKAVHGGQGHYVVGPFSPALATSTPAVLLRQA